MHTHTVFQGMLLVQINCFLCQDPAGGSYFNWITTILGEMVHINNHEVTAAGLLSRYLSCP